MESLCVNTLILKEEPPGLKVKVYKIHSPNNAHWTSTDADKRWTFSTMAQTNLCSSRSKRKE